MRFSFLALLTLFVATPARAAFDDEARFREAGTEYLSRLHARVHPRWNNFINELWATPAGTRYREDGMLTTEILLTIDDRGRVTRIEHVGRSGLPGFDQAPIDLIRDLRSPPTPPQSVRSDDGMVYVRWRFARGKEGCEKAAVVEKRLPPEEAIDVLVATDRAAEAVARVDELMAAGDEQARPLLDRLAANIARVDAVAKDPTRREAAARALGGVADGEIMLLRLASDADTSVRRAALTALGTGHPSAEAVAALEHALDGADAAAAAAALTHVAAPSAIEPLRRALAEARAPREVTAALIEGGDREGALRRAEFLLDGSAERRMAGAIAAAILADPTLAPRLLNATQGAHDDLRITAFTALAAPGARATPDARLALGHALTDENATVRTIAAGFALSSGDRSAAMRCRLIDALGDASIAVRAAATLALAGNFGEEALDELHKPAKDRAPEVRAALARALATHPFPRAVPLLNRLRADPAFEVRLALIEAARTSNGDESREILARAALDPDWHIRLAAIPDNGRPAEPEGLGEKLLSAANPLDRVRAAADLLIAHHPAPAPATRPLQAAL